jgi:hypothetical protein
MQPRQLPGLVKKGLKKLLAPLFKPRVIRKHFYFVNFISFEEAARDGGKTRNVRVLLPAQRVTFAHPETDPFVSKARLYKEGWFDRPDVFVCEVPDAYFSVDEGIIFTRDQDVLFDIEPRKKHFENAAYKKPFSVIAGKIPRREGIYSSINYFAAGNHYHWTVDCLTKIHSLVQYEPTRPVTLIMPESMGPVHRESLDCLLPANFRVEYHPARTWFRLEIFLLPSLVSGFYNGFLPQEYYDSVRLPVFKRFQLPATHSGKERLYISRRGSKWRSVLNEDAVMALLEPYGFRRVELEKLSFREQVELFHRAEVVAGPIGAGFNLLMYCGKISVVVLHPNQEPDNYFHTMAQGLGQSYHYVLHQGVDKSAYDDSFEADLPALKRVLETELGLKPVVATPA